MQGDPCNASQQEKGSLFALVSKCKMCPLVDLDSRMRRYQRMARKLPGPRPLLRPYPDWLEPRYTNHFTNRLVPSVREAHQPQQLHGPPKRSDCFRSRSPSSPGQKLLQEVPIGGLLRCGGLRWFLQERTKLKAPG